MKADLELARKNGVDVTYCSHQVGWICYVHLSNEYARHIYNTKHYIYKTLDEAVQAFKARNK